MFVVIIWVLKYYGGVSFDDLKNFDFEVVRKGMFNFEKYLENL